ncbi:hypothetical protein AB0N09_28150 [Streptomyces erythrochromogenes]|uniref:hypothetical protein n=1 Tax=Streptomyces erythrochromogenes TaxID=285574 RepID=UPI00341FBCB1
MNSLTRHLQAYPNPPATHVEALEQVLAAHAGEPENGLAITATSGVYGQGIRTGLTWGHLRALLAELNPAGPAGLARP